MSVRKVGNRWQVRVRLGNGERLERTLPPGSKLSDARQFEAQIRTAQIDAAVGRKPKYTIEQALTRWVESSAKKLRSWDRDLKYRVDVLRSYNLKLPLDALPDVADRIKARGQETLTAAAINRYVALLRRVGYLAERWGWTDKPLGRRVHLLPENSQRHVYLTPDQVRKLFQCADPLTADMIRFAALTGLRRGEMLPLRPDQVRGRILVLETNTKSGKPRGIPLPPEAIRIAEERLPWGISHWQLRTRWEAARAAAGLPDVHWHDLRHTFASWLVQAGEPLTAVRDLLGHSSLVVTNRYSHLAPAHLSKAIKALPSLGGENVGFLKRRNGRKKAA